MEWGGGGRFKRKGTYVDLKLIHVDIWKKPTQYCKAIILQLKLMVTTKQKLIHKTYRERVTENHQITKEESKRRGTTVSQGKQ